MAEKIKILIYEPYPFSKIAGNLRTLKNIIRYIDRNLFELIVVIPFKTDLIEDINKLGVECVVLDAPQSLRNYGGKALRKGPLGKLKILKDLWSYGKQLKIFIREKSINITYCNGIRSVLCAGIALRLSGVPVIWYVKGRLENPFYDFIAYIFTSRILFYTKTNSTDRYNWLRTIYSSKVRILPTGIDLNKILIGDRRGAPPGIDIDKKDINIGYVGQLYSPKGVHFLIEAFAELAKEHSNIKLYIVGDSIIEEYKSYENMLRKMAADYGIEGRIVFTGWRDDSIEIINCMDVIVHPSMAEGFARTVLESMALGRAVIATAVGGERETIVNGENGYLIEPGSVESIRDKLAILITDAPLRRKMGSSAAATIRKMHPIEKQIKGLEKIMEQLYSKI